MAALYLSLILVRFGLGGVCVAILSLSICFCLILIIFTFNAQAGFHIMHSFFFLDYQRTRLLRVNQHLGTPTLDFSQDFLALCDLYPDVVKNLARIFFLIPASFGFLSLLGCYGVTTKSVICTDAYSFVCSILLSLVSVIMYLLLVDQVWTDNLIQGHIRNYIRNDYAPMVDDVHMVGNILDFVQARFGCCGLVNVSDFEPPFKPPSCCRMERSKNWIHSFGKSEFSRKFDDCPEEMTAFNSNMCDGCYEIFRTFGVALFCGLVIDLSLLLLLGLLCSLLLRESLKDQPLEEMSEDVI